MSKILSGYAPSERRELLRRYLVMCVRDNVISFSEITKAPDKLMRTITADAKAVIVEIGRSGANGILGALGRIAQDVTGRIK